MSDEAKPEREARVEEVAYGLWDAAGRPDGGVEPFRERARELVAAEEARKAALHHLFFTNDQFPDGDTLEDQIPLKEAIQWNLDAIRRRLDGEKDRDE
jgi:hypothetical protein